MGTYITKSDLESRLSPSVVVQILDDNVDGVADKDPLDRLISDAESYVEGFLRGNYDLAALRTLGMDVPNEVKRLCLDIATAYAWDRHPEYVRADGDGLFKRTRSALVDLRKGITRLDIVGAPEPGANQGGVTYSGDPDDSEPENKVFMNGLGDF